MARHLRRLIHWSFAGVAALALLVLIALAMLWWRFDPDDYRAQIQARASAAVGRPVHLTGALRWQPGWRIALASEGGDIANAPGFGTTPLARWSRIRLGIALRPLFDRRVLIDRIDVEGLDLQLQRDAAGRVNWELQGADDDGTAEASSFIVRIAQASLRGGSVHYHDAATGAAWTATGLAASAKLPADLMAAEREFHDVEISAQLAGGPLQDEGVRIEFAADVLRASPQQLQLPAFRARWANATLGGKAMASLDDPQWDATLDLQAPSLRKLLATFSVVPPPMRDPDALGPLQMSLVLRHAAGAINVEELTLALDGTHLGGKVDLPRLDPPAIRFDLVADAVDLDRYREPDEAAGKPLELPLAWLGQLDAKGTLRIRQAAVAGAAAKEVRIDVE